jgi:hypothetical protein
MNAPMTSATAVLIPMCKVSVKLKCIYKVKVKNNIQHNTFFCESIILFLYHHDPAVIFTRRRLFCILTILKSVVSIKVCRLCNLQE